MKETKQKKSRKALAVNIMLLIMIISLIIPAVAAENKEKYGILVIAHGSPGEDWCAPVRDAVAEVDLPYPVELGFLEFVPNETINFAVERLDDAGVTKIIAIPLFISSHSSHIQEIEYVVGLRDTLPMTAEDVVVEGMKMERTVAPKGNQYAISYVSLEADTGDSMQATGHSGDEEEEELVPIDTDADIILTAAMDDHWLVAGIVADRTADLSENPEDETLVLVAHGTGEEDNFAGWVNSTESL
ncbi:MAG: CbiX/SirB N-terminal domain-containing protein, partial [Methanosarcinales archaeon]|nr:CbiX/SirB N-terminal domain-containing protein [Methanosarcinales archaeon]